MAKRSPAPASTDPQPKPVTSLKQQNTRLRQQRSEATEQKVADERYQHSQDRFRTVFENSPMGQKIIDPDLVIQQANQALATMLGLKTPKKVVGRRIREFAHPDFTEDWKRLQEELWEHKRPYFILETCLVRADKSSFWCQVTSVLFPDEGGELGYTTLEDITERRRLEADNRRLHLSQQQALFVAVQTAEETERQRISEGLHNGIGQLLYATKLHLDRLHAPVLHTDPALVKAHRETDQMLGEAIRQTRVLSHELTPLVLIDFGLAAALHDIGRKFNPPHLSLHSHVKLDETTTLPLALQLALYRMAQELTQNIIKHATGATKGHLELETIPGFILLRAEDNGAGFAVDPTNSPGIGLRSIRNRVALLGGELETGTVPTGGAYVRIRIPFPVFAAP